MNDLGVRASLAAIAAAAACFATPAVYLHARTRAQRRTLRVVHSGVATVLAAASLHAASSWAAQQRACIGKTAEPRLSSLLRMASAEQDVPLAPTDDAAPAAPGAPAKAAPRAPLCAGGAGWSTYFGPATAEAVTAELLLTSAVVVVLSIAGDAHGGATKMTLPAVTQRWMVDCSTTGISATSANAGLGITALFLTVAGAVAGLRVAGAAPKLFRARGTPRSEAGSAVLRSLRGSFLLLLGCALLASCVGVYAAALGRWLPSLRACGACRQQQLEWLATPRVSTVGRDCVPPTHLAAAPGGMQTIAGLLGGGALLCTAKLGALVAAAEKREDPNAALLKHTADV